MGVEPAVETVLDNRLDMEEETEKAETKKEKLETELLEEMQQGCQQISRELAGDKIEGYMEDVLKYYRKVQPFEHPMERCSWWCMNSYNYLFGINYDEAKDIKYYIYGVPGGYNEQAQRQMSMYGFYNWHPVKGKEKRQGVYGYWLAFADAKTGMVVKV